MDVKKGRHQHEWCRPVPLLEWCIGLSSRANKSNIRPGTKGRVAARCNAATSPPAAQYKRNRSGGQRFSPGDGLRASAAVLHLAVDGRMTARTDAHQVCRVAPCAAVFDRLDVVHVFGDRAAAFAERVLEQEAVAADVPCLR